MDNNWGSFFSRHPLCAALSAAAAAADGGWYGVVVLI